MAIHREDGAQTAGAKTGLAGRPGRKKKKIWLLVPAGVLAAAGLCALLLHPKANAALTIASDDTTVLAPGEFVSAISATGTVESADTHKIYSTQSYPVAEVCVAVGDTVTADTVLCRLDTGALEDEIEAKQTAAGVSAAAAAQQVKTAQDSYSAAKAALDNGQNESVISAEAGVRTAKESYRQAVTNYKNYKATLSDGLNATLISQDAAVDSASRALESAQDAADSAAVTRDSARRDLDDAEAALTARRSALSDAQDEYARALAALNAADGEDAPAKQQAADSARTALEAAQTAYDAQSAEYARLDTACDAAKTALSTAQTQLDAAQSGYDTAVKSRESAYRSADTALADYAAAVDSAYAAWQTALKSQSAAVSGAAAGLQSSYDSLAGAQTGADNSSAVLELAQLQQQLEDATIRAGAAGTVTAVYASVGGSGSGLLFVVEDTDELTVETSVKEYDVGSVRVGMPVTIRADTAQSESCSGTILSIAPTAAKDAAGDTASGADAEFAVKVGVSARGTSLRIGMSVRLSYILDRQENVLAVPYDAVYQNAAGESCVLVLDDAGDGGYTLRELAVTAGAENDLDILVSGSGVEAGLRIVNSPDSYTAMLGRRVTLTDGAEQTTSSPFTFG